MSGCLRRRLYAITFLISSLYLVEALAQWRTNQRSHQLSKFNDEELRRIAALGNITAVKELLKPILVQRIVDTPSHKKVALYIKKTLEGYGFHTEWDRFADRTPHGVKTFRNLIATYDPLAPRRLVLACHYDSKILPGQVFLAATDSAVPCAMMLDIARTLGQFLHNRSAQQITLQLIFLDGEEAFVEWTEKDSIYGARHLAEAWTKKWYPTTSGGSAFELSKEIDRIDVFMLLDLLGAANPRITSSYGHGTTDLFQELPAIESDLKRLRAMPRVQQIFIPGSSFAAVEDDHIPFMKRGVPIMHLIPVPFPHVWHTPGDNEAALDYNTIDALNTIIRVFVARYLGVHV
ncbi:Protein H27A22.1 a [Aphelenchoides avenae]|nr:Protein H27A22.1 a [Aphelenchus avenae]